MRRTLAQQQKIDLLAIAAILLLMVPIALVPTCLFAQLWVSLFVAHQPAMADAVAAGSAFATVAVPTLIFLAPLWFWLALRLRRRLNWPAGAFEKSTDRPPDSAE